MPEKSKSERLKWIDRGFTGAEADALASGTASREIRKLAEMPIEAPKAGRGFKRGGKVKKTGLAKVHKGEVVLTAKQAKRVAPSRKGKR